LLLLLLLLLYGAWVNNIFEVNGHWMIASLKNLAGGITH